MDVFVPAAPPDPAPPAAPPEPFPPAPPNRALTGLLVLAVLYTLHFAAEVILPLLVAALLAMLLSPLVHWLRRKRVPRSLAAGIVTASVVIGLGWGVEMLAAPAADWLQRAPQSIRELERKLLPVKKPVEQVKQATEQVERLTGGGDDKAPTVKVQSVGLGSQFLAGASMLAAQILVVVFLLFFLLSSGDRLLRRAAHVPKEPRNRRRLIAVARRVKQDVASYLGVITLINIGVGVAAGLAMWALGMPNPALWGVLMGLLNYVPYAGAFVTTVVVAMVGLLTFDELWRGLLPPAAILLINTLEADLVTPMLVGRRLTLPPMVVFLSLTIWTWMWGIAGAMLAVPLLVIFKVAADHLEVLRPLAPFLGAPNCGKSIERPRRLNP